MKKSKISASIIKKIKKEKIEQRSKLYFFAKFSLILFGAILFLIIGIIATAVIWHFFHDTELLEIFSIERMLFFKALLFSFPIFWLIISVLLGISVSCFARNTKKGYKVSYKIWFGIIILLQVLGGLALEQSPLGKHLEHNMMREIHVFKSRENSFQKLWQNPGRGLLIGEIFEIKTGEFLLEDLDEKEWKVIFNPKDLRNKPPLKIADKVRITGERKGELEFIAKKIMGLRFDYSRPPRAERRKPPFLEQRKPNKNNAFDGKKELMHDIQEFHKEQLGF